MRYLIAIPAQGKCPKCFLGSADVVKTKKTAVKHPSRESAEKRLETLRAQGWLHLAAVLPSAVIEEFGE